MERWYHSVFEPCVLECRAMCTGIDPGTVTALLQRWSHEEPEALAKLLPLVYDELHAIARSYMSHERPSHTLGTTGLVHETFLRLAGRTPETWQDRRHFYGIAAPTLSPVADRAGRLDADYLFLDRCLSHLERTNERRAQIVELRFFGGLTVNEIAEAKDLSPTTIKKELTIAKLWFFRQFQGEGCELPMQPPG